MEKVYKHGLMEPNMTEIGLIIRRMDTGNLFTLMVIFMKVNGKMIKLMEKEYTFMLMAQNMMEIGKMINNMDME